MHKGDYKIEGCGDEVNGGDGVGGGRLMVADGEFRLRQVLRGRRKEV